MLLCYNLFFVLILIITFEAIKDGYVLEKRENISSQAYKLYIPVYMELAECNMDIKLNASKIIIAPYVMDVFMTKNISVNRSGRKKLLDSKPFCPW